MRTIGAIRAGLGRFVRAARAWRLRTIGADILLLVVGLLVFGSAASALVIRGDLTVDAGGGIVTESPIGLYRVTYTTSDAKGGSQAVADFTNGAPKFTVSQPNITALRFNVACTDTGPGQAAPFELQIEIKAPNGLAVEPVMGTCGGTIPIPVSVTPVPESTIVQGDTPGDARQNIPKNANATRAVGDWEFTITGRRQGDPVGLPVARPAGNVDLLLTVWKADLTPLPK